MSSPSPRSSMSGSTRNSKLQRLDDENGTTTLKTSETIEVLEPVYEGTDDVVKLLARRQARGVYCGKIVGTTVCIDNLGSAFDEAQLQTELKQHLTGIQSVQFASIVIESRQHSAGYGAIVFDTLENAVRGLIRLEGLCIDAPGYPIPRPILGHFPNRPITMEPPDVPGYILEHGVSPHFCQPNTIEYDVAVEWRHLLKCLSLSKKRLCDVGFTSICKELIELRPHIDVASLRWTVQNGGPATETRTVICKGVLLELTTEQIRNAVEVTDHGLTIRRMKCPVMGQDTSTVFIEMSSSERAGCFEEDMRRFLFVMGRSPRPVEAERMKFGPPHGFEGIFDRAIESVFGLKLSQLDPSQFTRAHVVDISAWDDEKRHRSEKVRRILENLSSMRAGWKLESYEAQQDLHTRQKEWIEREMKKLELLEAAVPRFHEANDRLRN